MTRIVSHEGTGPRRHSGQSVLVVGLGKSGAATVRHLSRAGARMVLTDSRAAPAGLEALRARPGVDAIHVGALAAPEPLSQFAFAVVSPGVPLDDPFIERLRAAKLELIGDIELFARDLAATHASSPLPRVVGITGSNGKSTVTELVGAMAREAGLRVAVGGNLGEPALDLLDPAVQLYVLELSSFQLETTGSLGLAAATMLNLSADHLDRHGTLAAYTAAKARIYAHASVAIVNREDAATRSGSDAAAECRSFGLDAPADGDYGLRAHADGALWGACGTTRRFPLAGLRIAGRHNAANALAALALADAVGIDPEASLRALQAFPGLPHRCEWVAEIDGVTWINDSKGTNVGATLAALNGLDAPLVWLGGGQGKGQDFTPLRAPLATKARAAFVFGADAEQIARDLGDALPVTRTPDLDAAVSDAHALARSGDRVLLSPACASLDQFANYEARGARFRTLVQGLAR